MGRRGGAAGAAVVARASAAQGDDTGIPRAGLYAGAVRPVVHGHGNCARDVGAPGELCAPAAHEELSPGLRGFFPAPGRTGRRATAAPQARALDHPVRTPGGQHVASGVEHVSRKSPRGMAGFGHIQSLGRSLPVDSWQHSQGCGFCDGSGLPSVARGRYPRLPRGGGTERAGRPRQGQRRGIPLSPTGRRMEGGGGRADRLGSI